MPFQRSHSVATPAAGQKSASPAGSGVNIRPNAIAARNTTTKLTEERAREIICLVSVGETPHRVVSADLREMAARKSPGAGHMRGRAMHHIEADELEASAWAWLQR